MNAVTKTEAVAEVPTSGFAKLYWAERDHNSRMQDILTGVLFVMDAMLGEAERRGEDTTTRRAIHDNARAARWTA